MKTILIVIGTYLPGYKAGGPVQSIKNMIDRLGDEYSFKVLTGDRDLGDTCPYENIEPYVWHKVEKAEVMYVEPGNYTNNVIVEACKNVDIIYVCGPYNDYARSVLRLKKKGILPQKVIFAAMGSFRANALSIHRTKKKIYLFLMKKLGMFRNIEWSATSQIEVQEIKEVFGNNAKCTIAEDLPRVVGKIDSGKKTKNKHSLRILFLSRIVEIKNLDFAIKAISKVKSGVVFDIAGPIEDEIYWKSCNKMISELSHNIECNYLGMIESSEVITLMKKYDLFLFPTKSENYGHVIYESMAAGLIPVISNQTIWSEPLRRYGVGYVGELNNADGFSAAINRYIEMGNDEFEIERTKVSKYISSYSDSISLDSYRDMFS